ncbi:uncharacterized protein FFM5_15368 [Fusarium fujikuroi]|nr:uncharacterized protein FFM5_15368 [Fusarium fujikuroi]
MGSVYVVALCAA